MKIKFDELSLIENISDIFNFWGIIIVNIFQN